MWGGELIRELITYKSLYVPGLLATQHYSIWQELAQLSPASYWVVDMGVVTG